MCGSTVYSKDHEDLCCIMSASLFIIIYYYITLEYMIYDSIGTDDKITCACIEGLLATSASSPGTINLKVHYFVCM